MLCCAGLVPLRRLTYPLYNASAVLGDDIIASQCMQLVPEGNRAELV
jgi:hypothetical protein